MALKDYIRIPGVSQTCPLHVRPCWDNSDMMQIASLVTYQKGVSQVTTIFFLFTMPQSSCCSQEFYRFINPQIFCFQFVMYFRAFMKLQGHFLFWYPQKFFRGRDLKATTPQLCIQLMCLWHCHCQALHCSDTTTKNLSSKGHGSVTVKHHFHFHYTVTVRVGVFKARCGRQIIPSVGHMFDVHIGCEDVPHHHCGHI